MAADRSLPSRTTDRQTLEGGRGVRGQEVGLLEAREALLRPYLETFYFNALG